MSAYLNPPLTPRNGLTLLILIIARISTIHQDDKALEDQIALCLKWMSEHTSLPFEVRIVKGRGSGECLDRKESAEAIALIESGNFDVVITEDLGRIYRRFEAMIFCESCLDFETRVIAINDHVDTGDGNWKLSAFFDVMRHEAYNQDGSARIRRTQRNRFSQGGIIQTLPYGYEKPKGCKHDSQLRKLPEAEPIYDRWFSMLEEGASFAEIADWLNEKGIPTGPYCRSERWTSFMVGRVTTNPILKGVRVRNRKMSKRINKTGRRRSVDAPPGERLERSCPHLAFIDPERFDRVNRLIAERNAGYRRKRHGGVDPRRGVSKKRTPWPAQHVVCGVCGRLYYRGGHGRTDYLMCAGSRQHSCWNGVSFNGPVAARKLSAAIIAAIEALPDFESTFLDDLRREVDVQEQNRKARLRELDAREATNEREVTNVQKAIRDAGSIPILLEDLARLQAERDNVAHVREELVRTVGKTVALPSIDQIREETRREFADLALDSPEFARLMKRLIPEIFVKPYRLVDGGDLVLRAHLTLNLTPLVDGKTNGDVFGTLLYHELVVDLFEPPQRVAYLKQCLEMAGQHMKQRDIAKALKISHTAVQRAVALGRLMERLGVDDPYQLETEPPSDIGRIRRHRHSRFRFEPLEGFPHL